MSKPLFLLVLACMLAAFTTHAQQTFVVTDTSDAGDANPGDGLCDDGTGVCTYRAALEEANTTTAKDTIHFDFTAFSPFLVPQSPYPDITNPIIIDGTSEPDYSGTPIVTMDGNKAGFASAIVLTSTANGSVVKGLAIGNFQANSATPYQTGFGIELLGDSNTIVASYIGLERNGITAFPNDRAGIKIDGGSDNQIGSNAPAEKNLVSSNNQHGILLRDGAAHNTITGNFIGLNEFGSTSGNVQDGIHIAWGKDNTIGNDLPGGKNKIAGNGRAGIVIRDTSGQQSNNNRIARDSIYNNGQIGIDLKNDGISHNDPGDGDNGPNQLQNFPMLSNIEINGNTVDLSYEVPTDTSNAAYPLEVKFFKSDGNRQGRAFIGADSYAKTDHLGNPEKSISFTASINISSFDQIIAMATDDSGNTSEYGFTRPSPPSTTDSFRCGPGDVTLTASGISTQGAVYLWFNDTTDVTPIDTGNVFVTPYLTDTTGYWVAIEDTFGIRSHKVKTSAFIGTVPPVTFDSLDDVCITSEPVALTSGTPAGGNYSGPGVNVDSFYPNFAGLGTHVITYSYTAPNGCDSTVSRPITVHPLPNVSINDPGEFCVDAPDTALAVGSPAGGTYSGPGVVNDTFSPSMAGVGQHLLTYTYTDSNGCSSSASTTIQVNDKPNVSMASFDNICVNANPFFLSQGSPGGGTYSGPGVIGNQFYPDSAGVGTHTIHYTYTNFNGCDSTVSQPITVDSLPDVSLNVADQVCRFSEPVELTSGTPAGGTYAGQGVQGNMFFPAQVSVGAYEITYSYTSANGCSATVSDTINVTALPNVNVNFFFELCVSDSGVVLNQGNPQGGTYSGPGVVNDTFYPGLAGPGTHTIVYSFTDSNGCTVTDSDQLQVNDLPTLSFNFTEKVCVNQSNISLFGSGSPFGGDYSGPGISGQRFYPSEAGVGDHIITYTYTNSNGCTDSIQDTISVLPQPAVDAGLDKVACPGATVTLDGSGEGTFSWNPASGLSDPTIANPTLTPSFTRTYTLTVSDSNGCTNQDDVLVRIVNQITANAGPDTFVCSGRKIRLLAQGGSQYSWEPAHGLSDTSIANPLANPDSTTTYTVEVTSGNCLDQDTITVSTQPSPHVQYNASMDLCIDAAPFELTGGQPAGGHYFGTGVRNDSFLTDLSGSGQFAIGYTFENAGGCSDTAFGAIEVVDQLTVKYYHDTTCLNAAPYRLQIGQPYGGTYAGPGVVNDTVFNPAQAGLGTHKVAYNYSATQACTGSDTILITVHPFPNVNVGGSPEYCRNAPPDTLRTGTPLGGYYEGPGIRNNVLYPDSLTPGQHNVTYTFENEFGCAASESFTITILPVPATGLVADTFLCRGASIQFQSMGGNFFDWSPGSSLNDSTAISPTASPSQTTTYTLVATTLDGCQTVDTSQVKVYENPMATAIDSATICQEDCIRLGGTPTATQGNPPYQYTWAPATALNDPVDENPLACLMNSTEFTLTVTDSAGCQDRDTVNINVLNHPPVAFDIEIDSFTIEVTDNTVNAVSRTWHFGDGNTDTSAQTSHTYDISSLFKVCLEVTFPNGCVDSTCEVITIVPTGLSDPGFSNISIYPNPTEGQVVVAYDQLPEETTLAIHRLDGRLVERRRLSPGRQTSTIDLNEEPQGIYLIKLFNGNHQRIFRVVKM